MHACPVRDPLRPVGMHDALTRMMRPASNGYRNVLPLLSATT